MQGVVQDPGALFHSVQESSLESQDRWTLHLLGYFHSLHLKARPLWYQWYFTMMALKSLDNSDGMA